MSAETATSAAHRGSVSGGPAYRWYRAGLLLRGTGSASRELDPQPRTRPDDSVASTEPAVRRICTRRRRSSSSRSGGSTRRSGQTTSAATHSRCLVSIYFWAGSPSFCSQLRLRGHAGVKRLSPVRRRHAMPCSLSLELPFGDSAWRDLRRRPADRQLAVKARYHRRTRRHAGRPAPSPGSVVIPAAPTAAWPDGTKAPVAPANCCVARRAGCTAASACADCVSARRLLAAGIGISPTERFGGRCRGIRDKGRFGACYSGRRSASGSQDCRRNGTARREAGCDGWNSSSSRPATAPKAYKAVIIGPALPASWQKTGPDFGDRQEAALPQPRRPRSYGTPLPGRESAESSRSPAGMELAHRLGGLPLPVRRGQEEARGVLLQHERREAAVAQSSAGSGWQLRC